MTKLRFAALAALFLFASPALAQWQTPNHSVPIGRGAGVTGFGSAAPGASGRPIISNGASADPSFGSVSNNGIVPGAANSLKGSLDGTNTTDIAVPACSSVGQALQWVAGTGPQCYTISVFTGFDMPINMGLSSSAAGNALTITLTTASGATPSAGSPVLVPFRSTGLATGTVTWRTITSTKTLTVPSGATLGASSSNVPFRVWLFLEDNSGTPELAVATCSNTTSVFPCASWEHTLKTSIVLDTASDSAGVLYAPTAVAADAVRIVGFCDYSAGLTTAGTWASACTTLQPYGPGVKKPGDVVQGPLVAVSTSTTSSSSATKVQANPSLAITPTSTPNLIRVFGVVTVSPATNIIGCNVAVSRSTTFTALTSSPTVSGGSNQSAVIVMSFPVAGLDAPGTVSSTTYVPFVWSGGSGTCNWNGTTYGTAPQSYIELYEIMGALSEPANDNIHPGFFSRAG